MLQNIEDTENYISIICTTKFEKDTCDEYTDYKEDKNNDYILISDPIRRIADKRY